MSENISLDGGTLELGYCVIDVEKPSEGENYYSYHEWAEHLWQAQHTMDYEQDVNNQYHDAFISQCGGQGCRAHCPALHAKRPREMWPLGFTKMLQAGLVKEPENPPTFEEWLNLNRGGEGNNGKA